MNVDIPLAWSRLNVVYVVIYKHYSTSIYVSDTMYPYSHELLLVWVVVASEGRVSVCHSM